MSLAVALTLLRVRAYGGKPRIGLAGLAPAGLVQINQSVGFQFR